MLQNLFYIFEQTPALLYTSVAIFGASLGILSWIMLRRIPQYCNAQWRYQCCEFLELPLPAKPPHILHAIFQLPINQIKQPKIYQKLSILILLSVILCISVAYKFGATWTTFAACILTWALITQATIDLETLFIPDEITMPMLWLGLLLNAQGLFVPPVDAIVGAIAGYCSLWIVAWLFYLATRKQGMGHGDFKLLAMLGAWLGWQMLPCVILCASVLGSIIGLVTLAVTKRSRHAQIPFGPFLSVAGWIGLVCGSQINAWYLDFLGIL